MQRVAIVGAAGAGKAALAETLGDRMALAVHRPEPGTAPAAREAWARAVCAGPAWVIAAEGARCEAVAAAAADLVIWLDMPLALRLWRLARRGEPAARLRAELRAGLFHGLDLRSRHAALLKAEARARRVMRLGGPGAVRDLLAVLPPDGAVPVA
ncbi:hypothetical protein [Frigidibacter oleivorans]|uniref:hypothetical protein n=1 Tax=Frigidibacter oleivorans TaxID=2487129 RepID=UPI000F8D8F3C|nr:hypothetical protein [Frigidibacter oleivorans]